MTSYKNLAGNVGICSYELGEKVIRVKFHSHKNCIYDAQNTSDDHVNAMSRLALQGHGLNDYIVENESGFRAIALD
ncbi:MAG: hypothetical protein V3U64_03720 [Cocleimonas sp.]